MSDIETKLKAGWEAQDRFEIETCYRELMKTPAGRRFLYYLLEITKFMQQPFNGQALGTAFACGEMNVGKRILADILSINPDAFVNMMKEATDVERARTSTLTDAYARPDAYSSSEYDA